jgi:hypothetical protein
MMMRVAVENANKVMNLFPAHSGVLGTHDEPVADNYDQQAKPGLQ